ncbi:MAG: trigger factor [Clostridia bacterium]|jgi:trigger factor|nr:trigger factor [Clostridia bacterium]
MALKNSKKVSTNTYEVEIVLDKAAFDAEVNKVYRKNVSKMNVPGFRRGKAPKSVLEKMYGSAVFYEEAIDNLLPEAYSAAIAEAKLDVVSRPDIELVSTGDEGVVLKATVTVKPTVKVSEYKGLTAERPEVTVTEEEITREIDSVRNRNARVLTVEDRAAELGDEAIIDFEGFLDGVAFEGGKGEKHPLKLGSGNFIPGFEEQIVGHNKGESFDITVTFPEEYGEASLAGKETVFKIVLHEIKRTELPELDDEFVKDVSEFDTVDEYKASISAKIADRKNNSADAEVENQLIDKLIANMTGEIPECMIESEIDRYVNDYDYRLKSQGASLEMYYQYTGSTEEKLRESFKAEAERQVKSRLALERVAKTEKIKAGKKEMEEEYKKIASGYNVDIDYVKKNIPEEGISEDIVMRKAIQVIKDNAVITTKTTTEENA